MITVHYLNNSRAQRILWLLEELELPYKIERYQRHPLTMLAPPELKKIHPLGKSPVITDDSAGERVVVAESGAIIEYLLETYGKGRLRPSRDCKEGRNFTYWLHFAEGSLMPPLLIKFIFSKLSEPPTPIFLRPVGKAFAAGIGRLLLNPQLKASFDFMESTLSKHKWFAGEEFSAADIQMSYPVEAAVSRAGVDNQYPKLQAFLANIRSRPAFQRAFDKGGEMML